MLAVALAGVVGWGQEFEDQQRRELGRGIGLDLDGRVLSTRVRVACWGSRQGAALFIFGGYDVGVDGWVVRGADGVWRWESIVSVSNRWPGGWAVPAAGGVVGYGQDFDANYLGIAGLNNPCPRQLSGALSTPTYGFAASAETINQALLAGSRYPWLRACGFGCGGAGLAECNAYGNYGADRTHDCSGQLVSEIDRRGLAEWYFALQAAIGVVVAMALILAGVWWARSSVAEVVGRGRLKVWAGRAREVRERRFEDGDADQGRFESVDDVRADGAAAGVEGTFSEELVLGAERFDQDGWNLRVEEPEDVAGGAAKYERFEDDGEDTLEAESAEVDERDAYDRAVAELRGL